MIWPSISLMTFIDMMILGIVGYAAVGFLRDHRRTGHSSEIGFLAILGGLSLVALFYLADLLVMHAFPSFMPRAEAMKIMRELHLNGSWLVALLGIGTICFGFTLVNRATATLVDNLETRQNDLNRELAKHKRIEVALRESERRSSAIFDQTAVGIVLSAPDGRWLQVNRKMRDILGYEESELSNFSFRSITHADDLDGLARLEAGDIPSNDVELRFIRKDGSIAWAFVTVSLVRDAEGKLDYYLTIVENIWRRAQMQETLRESEAHYRDIFHEGPSALWIDDWSPIKQMIDRIAEEGVEDWRAYFANNRVRLAEAYDLAIILECSNANLEIYGASSKEAFLATNRAAQVQPAELDAFAESLIGIIEGEFSGVTESLDDRMDGTEFVVRAQYVIPLAHRHDWSRIIYSLEDVTDRSRAEEALRESRDHVRLITNSLPVFISYFDPDQQFRFVNRTAQEWFARSAEEVLGCTIREVIGPEAHDQLTAHLEAALSGKEQRFEQTRTYPDGQTRGVEITYVPHLDESGEVQGCFALVHDMTKRKRAEQALLESEARFKDFAEGTNDWIWEMDSDFRYTYISSSHEQYSGVPSGRVIGHTRSELYAQVLLNLDAQEVEHWQEFNGFLEAKQAFRNFEQKWVRLDGEVRHFLTSGKPVFDAQGRFAGYRGVGSDITELKRRDERLRKELEWRVEERTAKLRESQERLSLAAQSAKFGAWSRRISDDKVIWDEPTEAIFGLEPGAFEGTMEAFLSRVHPDDRERITTGHRRLMEEGAPYATDFRIAWPGGEVRHIATRASLVRGDRDSALQIIGMLQDITEVKHAAAALEASEERFRKAFHASPDMIFLSEIDTGRYRDVNDMFVEKVGYSRSELIGTSSLDLDVWVNLDDRNRLLGAVRKYGEVRGFESQFRAKSGAIVDYVTNAITVELEGKKYLFSFLHDVTERKRLEKQLLRQERLATLGQLTATVSHELRNPLGVIRTSAFTVQDGLNGETPRVQRALQRIERSVIRCDRIIDELLDFTRISEIEAEPTPIDAWLEEALNEQTLPSGVALRSEFGMPGLAVPFDHDRFRRAIINVFDNGCQAMVGEGQEDTGSEEHTLTVRTQKHDGRVEVIFEDTGPGIPPDVYEKIFEPLYSTKGFGVGLGLSVVKQIMEQHGGGIEIESQEGRGTRVCLWIPTNPSVL